MRRSSTISGNPAKRQRKLLIADLFAGAGGITQGFKDAGYEPVLAVEADKWAALAYAENFGNHVLACPIESVAVRKLNDGFEWTGASLDGTTLPIRTSPIDVLVGGPPCQGFSPLGRMSDWSRADPRNRLWRFYAKIIDVVRPMVFLIENVPELLKSEEFAVLKRRANALGYELAYDVLNAVHYGVPQVRRRAIIIGSRCGMPTLPPAIVERLSVRDAISDLPLIPRGIPKWHVPRKPTGMSLERYRCVPEGGNRFDLMAKRPDITPRCWLEKLTGSTDVFGRMWWDKPAPTIRTEFFKPEKGRYLHPVAHRPITIREAARLQTFPDDFAFAGSNVQAAKQIGNAVPVKLARCLAEHIMKMLLDVDLRNEREISTQAL
jgi:DNA (cytosine-5)-methyltransferase 1